MLVYIGHGANLRLCAPCCCVCEQVRGMEKTINFLVKELAKISIPIRTDKDMMSVASVAAGVCVCMQMCEVSTAYM